MICAKVAIFPKNAKELSSKFANRYRNGGYLGSHDLQPAHMEATHRSQKGMHPVWTHPFLHYGHHGRLTDINLA